jgi:hypothetical protein
MTSLGWAMGWSMRRILSPQGKYIADFFLKTADG